MAQIFLAAFLIVFGLNILLGAAMPAWIPGLLALLAGLLLLAERMRIRIDRR